ncbi:MAG: hypothetical protein WCJ81_08275 [bacterium]
MALQKNVKIENYAIDKTDKPANTSIKDLGLSLTGKTEIIISTEEKGRLSSLFVDQILPLLLFFGAIVVFFKFFGPKGGAGGMPFNIQA